VKHLQTTLVGWFWIKGDLLSFVVDQLPKAEAWRVKDFNIPKEQGVALAWIEGDESGHPPIGKSPAIPFYSKQTIHAVKVVSTSSFMAQEFARLKGSIATKADSSDAPATRAKSGVPVPAGRPPPKAMPKLRSASTQTEDADVDAWALIGNREQEQEAEYDHRDPRALTRDDMDFEWDGCFEVNRNGEVGRYVGQYADSFEGVYMYTFNGGG